MVFGAEQALPAAGAVFGVLLPAGFAIWWQKTHRVRLLPFMAGIFGFLVFAVALEGLFHRACLLSDHAFSQAIQGSTLLYALYGGLAAGVFEETGRFALFTWLIGKRSCPERVTAVAYGIGHGGAESVMVLSVTYGLYTLISAYAGAGNEAAVLMLTGGDPEALAAIMRALEDMTPGVVFLAALERVSAMLLHISLSCFVFLAARDRSRRWLFPAAVVFHAAADFPAELCQRGILPPGPAELLILLLALCLLYAARRFYLEEMDP